MVLACVGALVAGDVTDATTTPSAVTTGSAAPVSAVAVSSAVPDAVSTITPQRVLDTRGGAIDAPVQITGKRAADVEFEVTIAGLLGIPGDASGAMVNLTVTQPEGPGYMTMWPCGQPRPVASTLNFTADVTVANAGFVALGQGRLCGVTTASAHVLIDVTGFTPAGSVLQPTTPFRLLDTRGGPIGDGDASSTGRLAAGAVLQLKVAGRAGLPAEEVSTFLNATVTQPDGDGYLTVWPCGAPAPEASVLNFVAGQTIANGVFAGTGDGGFVCIRSSVATHVIVDLGGWVPNARPLAAVTPRRLLDTRGGPVADAVPSGGRLDAEVVREVRIAGRAGVPADVRTVAMSIVATGGTASGYVSSWPCGSTRRNTSTVNFAAGATVANNALVRLGADGSVCLAASASVDVILDVTGFVHASVPMPEVAVDSALAATTPTVEDEAGGAPRPVDVIADHHGATTEFVRGEVLVSTADPAELEAFVDSVDGTVVSSVASADGTLRISLVRLGAMASSAVATSSVANTFAADLRRLAPDIYFDARVSSAEGLRTLAVVAAHTGHGSLLVAPNTLRTGDTIASGTTREGALFVPETPDLHFKVPRASDAFDVVYLRSGGPLNMRVTQAWQYLEAAGRLANNVEIAVIDGGIGREYDFRRVGSMETEGTANQATCGGQSCPWHGNGVGSIAAATVDDGIGTAGVAGPVASIRRFETNVANAFSVVRSLFAVDALPGSRVVNMSFSGSYPAITALFVEAIEELLYTSAARNGNVLVAAAGNDTVNVDEQDCFIVCWEAQMVMPCEATRVLCVGALRPQERQRDWYSNYGAGRSDTVDLFAPGTVLIPEVQGVPGLSRGTTVGDLTGRITQTQGTSFASPYVAGVAALVWAANPALSGAQVVDVLMSTSDQSAFHFYDRIVNPLSAVRAALGNVAPAVRITAPAPGTSPLSGAGITFEASVSDIEDGASCCEVQWTSDVDGALGAGTSLHHVFSTPGVRTITATARDRSGATATATVRIDLTLDTLVAAIVEPLPGSTVERGIPLQLRAAAAGPDLGPRRFTYAWTVRGSMSAPNPEVLTAGGRTAVVTPQRAGVYRLDLLVTDNFGQSRTATADIIVRDPLPVLTVARVTVGGADAPTLIKLPRNTSASSASFAATVSGGSAPYIYRWTWIPDPRPGQTCETVTWGASATAPFNTNQVASAWPNACLTALSSGRIALEVVDGNAQVARWERAAYVDEDLS